MIYLSEHGNEQYDSIKDELINAGPEQWSYNSYLRDLRESFS